MDTNIWIVCTDEGLIVVYALKEVTESEIKAFFNKVVPQYEITDIYEEKQSNLQYYCIDGRVWIDEPIKVERMRKAIAA